VPRKCRQVRHPLAVFVFAKGWEPHCSPRTHENPGSHPGLDPGTGHSAKPFQNNSASDPQAYRRRNQSKGGAKRVFHRRRPKRRSLGGNECLARLPAFPNLRSSFHLGDVVHITLYRHSCMHRGCSWNITAICSRWNTQPVSAAALPESYHRATSRLPSRGLGSLRRI
jgi:hypothetical protein